ncbi:MAG: hypothetical protein AB1597_07185 [Chloroflexota bacterium]
MKRPEWLVLIAVWEFVAAFLAFLGLIALLIAGFLTPMAGYANGMRAPAGMVWAYFGMSIAAIVVVGYLGLCLAAGIGILAGAEWARICAIVQGGLSCLSFPFGTAIGVLVIIYLSKVDVRAYFDQKRVAGVST